MKISYTIRKSEIADIASIHALYLDVSKNEGGIARSEDEITFHYVENFCRRSHENGLQILAINDDGNIIGEIHAYIPEPKVFAHVLSDLTLVVSPQHQGKGIGRKLFQVLIEEVTSNRHDILRIELIARESNVQAIKLYESLGFRQEGRMERRIKGIHGSLEADIPMALLIG